MARTKRPTVTLNCPADKHATTGERIIEFNSEVGGGLISFTVFEGKLIVDVYRVDENVIVYGKAY